MDIFWTFYLNHLSPLWGYFLGSKSNFIFVKLTRLLVLNTDDSSFLAADLDTSFTDRGLKYKMSSIVHILEGRGDKMYLTFQILLD